MRPRRQLSLHGRTHPSSSLSASMLSGGAGEDVEILYRSPSPMPVSALIAEARNDEGRRGDDGSTPPPVVQLLVTRSTTPDLA